MTIKLGSMPALLGSNTTAFKNAFAQDVAQALGISANRISVTGVTSR